MISTQDENIFLTVPGELAQDHPVRQLWEEHWRVREYLFDERDKFRPIHYKHLFEKNIVNKDKTIEYGFEKKNIAWAIRPRYKNIKLKWNLFPAFETLSENHPLKETLLPLKNAHQNLLGVRDKLKKVHKDYISQKCKDKNFRILDIKYDWREWDYSNWDHEYNCPAKNVYTYTVSINMNIEIMCRYTCDWNGSLVEVLTLKGHSDETMIGLPVGTTACVLDEETKKERNFKFVQKNAITVEEAKANLGQEILSIDCLMARALKGVKKDDSVCVDTPNGGKNYKILDIKYPQ